MMYRTDASVRAIVFSTEIPIPHWREDENIANLLLGFPNKASSNNIYDIVSYFKF